MFLYKTEAMVKSKKEDPRALKLSLQINYRKVRSSFYPEKVMRHLLGEECDNH